VENKKEDSPKENPPDECNHSLLDYIKMFKKLISITIWGFEQKKYSQRSNIDKETK
jgi:hypothetical protein